MIPCRVACLAFIAWIGAVSGVPEGEEDGFCKKSADEDCGKEPEKKFRKTALITGGAGFVAHHVIEGILDTTDWNIVSMDRLDFSGKLNRIQDMLEDKDEDKKKRVRVIYGDLRAPINDQLARDIGHVHVILHLAAGANVDRSIERPLEFVMDNTVATVNVMEFARKHQPDLDRFIYLSTAEVFGPAPPGVSHKEYDRYNSGNPYAAAKAAAEEFAVSYENTYKMPIVIVHTMNVYGERQGPTKFIPRVVNAVKDGKEVTIHADSTRTTPGSRRYIHAKDVADGLLFILSLPKDYKHEGDFGGAKCPKFNLVGEEEVDNLQLANIIAETVGKELKYKLVDFHSSRPGHDLRYDISGDLLASLGWKPKTPLRQRIAEFAKWVLNNPRWSDETQIK